MARFWRASSLLSWGLLLCATASAASFTINSTGDEPDSDTADNVCMTSLGACTLRAAIEQSNVLPGPHVIGFAIPGPGVHTIHPLSVLPSFNATFTMDGYTQAGSSPNTVPADVGTGGALLTVLTIEIDLSSSGVFPVTGNSVVRGIAWNRSAGSALLLAGGGAHIEGCFIGTDPTGQSPGPGNGSGITVGSANNVIGGLTPASRNLISGNVNAGIEFGSGAGFDNNMIQGNVIGLNALAQATVGNGGDGVAILESRHSNNLIGGTSPSARNIISGNGLNGIELGGTTFTLRATGTTVQGNFIGLSNGGAAKPNQGDGILIADSNLGNTIGGAAPGAGNLISGNGGYGVRIASTKNVVSGNSIGLTVSGTSGVPGHPLGNVLIGGNDNTVGGTAPGAGNHIAFGLGAGVAFFGPGHFKRCRISSNSIHDHSGPGIDFEAGILSNDPCDSDSGTNDLQNWPVVTSASIASGSVNLSGSLDSTASTTFRLEFFSNFACDSSGRGEGKTYLGFVDVTTDGTCNAPFGPVTFDVPAGENVITATATDPSGNTSEFSPCFTASSSFYSLPPCRVVDTRNPAGTLGGPALVANVDRTFTLSGVCGVPVGATAVALNVAVTQSTAGGDLRLFAATTPLPLVSAINYNPGQTRANNAIIPLSTGAGGGLTVRVDQPSGTVHLILDVTGYFQ
jgi:hypothetical protein